MSDLLIKNCEMPTFCGDCPCLNVDYCGCIQKEHRYIEAEEYLSHRRPDWCPLVEVPKHGQLIDADELRGAMYHEAFEKDSDMQRRDSGCWIRYKMFEKTIEAAPTVIEASEDGEQDG